MSLEVGAPSVQADGPAADRSERVADRASESDGDVGRKPVLDRPTEEHDVLAGERSRRDCAPVDHHDLARGREQGIDEHEDEDGIEAVVADRRGDGVREVGHDRGDQHRGARIEATGTAGV